MNIITEGLRVPIKSWCATIEPGALKQAVNLTKLPFVYGHVAVMADCHEGFGMPIGGVIACKDAIIPNAVGVDIGCGMCAVQTDLPVSSIDADTVRTVLNRIRGLVPMGFDHHKHTQDWKGFDRAPDVPIIQQELDSARKQLGTLGGGNHFIEIQAGNDGHVWLMIHSGSRNFGYKVAGEYHEKALAYCRQHNIELPDNDLAFFPMDKQLAREYKTAMDYALDFAAENRQRMKQVCQEQLRAETRCGFLREINIHHNFAAEETHYGRTLIVHRKGATRAGKGQSGIIPGSMGSSSYIVQGRGNPDSFLSSSHGAGRIMGRNEANRRLTYEEVRQAMRGIVFDTWPRGRKGKIDLSEAPQAYKDINAVMASQKDLVDVKVKLRPLGVVKG
ncbi:MAG TPA: RtcB family protein [Chitinivibrionales bacterium]|nr:RtcB family protein [Chitinivibrionales bacterium]